MHAKLRNVSFSFISNAESGLASFVTMMLVLVRERMWDILERGLEAGVWGLCLQKL